MLIDGPDCRLWADVRGEGTPVTVFAHGITSSSAEVAPFARRTPGARVLFDFRGHGRSESPPPEAGYDTRAMRRDLVHVADRYGATRAMGVSMGAAALLGILAEQPRRFERLVFFLPAWIDGPHIHPLSAPDLADELEATPVEELARRSVDSPVYRPIFERRPKWRRLVHRRILRMNSTGVPRALRLYPQGPPPVPDARALARVSAPALILAHREDPIHDVAVAERLAALLPDATLRVWDEPLAMLDDVGAFARLVGDFIAGAEVAA